jgi:hypothetical protein
LALGDGVIAHLAFQLLIGIAVAFGRNGDADLGQNFVVLARRVISAEIECPRTDPSLPIATGKLVLGIKAHHKRRHVIARIAIGDIAANSADVTDLGVANQQGCLTDDRQNFRQQRRSNHFGLGCHCADCDMILLPPNAFETADAGEINKVLGGGKAGFHDRDQAMAAR